jgi:lipoprotein-anchoring transpeptidase ErfK/SrfK
MKIHGIVFALLAVIAGLTGCAHDVRLSTDTVYLGGRRVPVGGTPQANEKRMNFDNVSYWDGDGATGPARVRISLGEQRAYFYKGEQLVGISILSTGREGHNSPTGSFHIIQKDIDHVSSIYGDYIDAKTHAIVMKEIDRDKDKMPKGCIYDGARMPFFMRITGGVGMHEGFLPGYPASHGCIRMPGFMAEAFFRNVEVGTPVTITP